jgi:hypothetical protein
MSFPLSLVVTMSWLPSGVKATWQNSSHRGSYLSPSVPGEAPALHPRQEQIIPLRGTDRSIR